MKNLFALPNPKKQTSLLTVFAFLTLFYSCDKEPLTPSRPICDEPIPCLESAADNNFVAAYFNGEPWESRNDAWLSGLHEIEASYNLTNRAFLLLARRKYDEFSEYLVFGSITNEEEGIFKLNLPGEDAFRDYKTICLETPDGSSKYAIDSTFTHQMDLIKFDFEDQVAEGYFQLRVINHSCNDTITITDGRFRCSFHLTE